MFNIRLKSIRHKLALSAATFFILFILGFLLLNHLFLEDYYIYRLKSEMAAFAEEIVHSGSLTNGAPLEANRGFQNLIRNVSDASGHRLEVIDRNSSILLSSVPEFNPGDRFEFPQNLTDYLGDHFDGIDSKGSESTVLRTPSGDQSVVMHVSTLTDDHYLVMTAPLDEIEDNVAIANRFFLGMGITLALVWAVVIFALSKTITAPIVKISHQAKAIAAFDFSAEYDGQTADEIGQLGLYMNHISNELEKRITELNARNLRLKDDMDLQRRFLASISHEFKSPVGIIKGYAESIKLGYYENDTEKNQLADRILDASDQMTTLVEDMIMLSKLDKRAFRLTKGDMDLSDLLDRTCMKIEEQYSSSQVNFHMEIQNGIMLNGDSVRLVQVFDNLLINGFRYTTSPWDFEVAMTETADGIHITFSNSCNPIESGDLEQIFTPFYRFEKSHNKKTGGHGLGLSVVKALVEAHGGTVSAAYADQIFTVTIVL